MPRLWLKEFRYRPLLAETFCDIERTAGTCYKAAGWIPLGSEGYESLYDALRHVRDTRDSNRTFPIGGMLAIVVMAMMSGANSVKAIARFAKRLTMVQRRVLCMPHAKNAAGVVAKHEYKVPSYVTLYNFLRTLDLVDFGEKLSGWMASQDGRLPRQLALDGKFVKEVMGVVSVVNAETGSPVAVAACSRKEGEKGRCEMPVGRKLLGRLDLSNALVSSDALHCQQDAVRGQWAIESKYHARRDGAYCEDIRTRRCDENVTGAMLLARSPVFVFLAQSGMENCQAFKEELQSDRNRIFRLVTGRSGA